MNAKLLLSQTLNLVITETKKNFYQCPKNQSYNERILSFYGKSLENKLIEVETEGEQIELLAYISTPEYFRATRDLQFCFVNNRAVEIKNLSFVVRKAYGELIAHGMQPCFFIFLNINTTRLDINVHPQKREVRLLDQSLVQGIIYKAITNAFRSNAPININQVTHTNHPFTNQNQNYNQGVSGIREGLQNMLQGTTMNVNSNIVIMNRTFSLMIDLRFIFRVTALLLTKQNVSTLGMLARKYSSNRNPK